RVEPAPPQGPGRDSEPETPAWPPDATPREPRHPVASAARPRRILYMTMTREERVKQRLFPDVQIFAREGGFVPLPMVLRRAQFLFGPREWQIYCYVLMRSGPAGMAWFTLDELAYDLNFRSVAKLKPYLMNLVAQGWLCQQSSQGRDYY